jgi:hypothetical protein
VTLTLIEHWDGVSWSVVASPNPGTYPNGFLYGVDAVSANDVWAVGFYFLSGPTQNPSQTLIEHWDGVNWSVVPSPNYGLSDNKLFGITAVSSNNLWAVGNYTDQSSQRSRTLTEQWTGTGWVIVPTPDTAGRSLNGVAGIASNDVWAVGTNVILHWNGSVWTDVPDNIPFDICLNPRGIYKSVSVVASDNVWATGFCSGSGFSQTAYVAHWDGSQWSVTSLGFLSSGPIQLNSVKAISADDVWAVGSRYAQGRHVPWVEHWDGSQWTTVLPVDPEPIGPSVDLYGIATTGGDELWVVGSFLESASSPEKTLVDRYFPTCPPPLPCPGERFTDVCPTDYFYTPTLALANDGIISGYNTVPPCDNTQWIPCFKPYNNVTRGQASKIVSLAANFNDPVTGQSFEDVPPGAAFYTYTERMAERGIIVGYPCGGPGLPCVPPDNRPYFRPNNYLTRGQMAKIVALSFGWNNPPVGQEFEDIPPGAPFYTYTSQLYIRTIIVGYSCGGPNEPCVPPGNRPYYRPNNNVIRAQTAKIVQLARTQPTPTPTPTSTTTPADTATPATTATPPELTPSPTGTPANPTSRQWLAP